MAAFTPRTMRAFPVLLGLLLAAGVGQSSRAAEFEPVPVQHAAAPESASGRFIVKFRDADGQGAAQAKTALDKMAALSSRTGVPLKQARRLGAELQVVRLGSPATLDNVEASLALLRADPDVEFAEPDLRRYAQAQPSDPLFPGQWYLQNSLSTASAVDAVGAWDLTTGSAGVIVAVLDTGVRYEHPDLLAASAGGKLLPGFDFVLDPVLANDGDGWDADASDPGDWITSSEAGSGTFGGCTPSSSSWHGTRVSGIVGALANNSRGIAGTAWSGWILPARGLGKCGGTDSDIIAAMLWAGGVPVDGAPANPYPARIINMSLGGRGSCLQSYRTAVSQLAARGALVIASVGNAGGQVVAPANCPGVVGVAGLRHVGTKVGFSNLGPGVALSAPGGNCVNTGPGSPCLFSIDTTTNLGTTGPTASSYTDQFDFNVGTSFSAPIVSGIAALMLSVNNRLSPAQLLARLQEGATLPFPTSTDPTVPVCRVPTSSTDIQAVECVCTTQTCGAGMANALASVRSALRPVAAVSVPSSVSPGQNVVLRAGGSGAACGRGLSGYSWTIVDGGATPPGIVGADTDTATLIAPSSGSYTLRLTVTDDAGDTDSADVIVSPNAATTTAPSAAGGPACPTPITVTLPVTITVTPASVSLVAGVGTQGFTASVSNAPDPRVDWFVNDVPGGNATVGTISASGFYTAPASRPSPSSVTVKAVSVADSSRSATATVTIASPAPATGGGGGGGGGRIDLMLLLALGLGVLARRPRHRP
jgi:serine protease